MGLQTRAVMTVSYSEVIEKDLTKISQFAIVRSITCKFQARRSGIDN